MKKKSPPTPELGALGWLMFDPQAGCDPTPHWFVADPLSLILGRR